MAATSGRDPAPLLDWSDKLAARARSTASAPGDTTSADVLSFLPRGRDPGDMS
jgi:hypothetical protein